MLKQSTVPLTLASLFKVSKHGFLAIILPSKLLLKKVSLEIIKSPLISESFARRETFFSLIILSFVLVIIRSLNRIIDKVSVSCEDEDIIPSFISFMRSLEACLYRSKPRDCKSLTSVKRDLLSFTI